VPSFFLGFFWFVIFWSHLITLNSFLTRKKAVKKKKSQTKVKVESQTSNLLGPEKKSLPW